MKMLMVEMMGQHSNQSVKARLAGLYTAVMSPDQELRCDQAPMPGEEGVRIPQRVRRRLDSEQEAQLVTAYRAGVTTYQLAAHFGISRKTVSTVLKRHGVALRNQSLSTEQIEAAISLYAAGLSLARVGEKLGCDATTVRLALIKAGVPTRDSHGRERQSSVEA